MSRAYYAIFHRARLLVETCGVICPKSASAHEKIPFCLTNSQHSELESAGQKVLDIRGLRNKSDYSLDDRRWSSQQFVKSHVAHAQVAFLELGELRGRIAEFESTVREYATNVLRFSVQS